MFGITIVQTASLWAISYAGKDKLLPIMTGATTSVLIASSIFYLPHLLARPYISFRVSKNLGDPLNDAELFNLRTIALGGVVLTISDAAFSNNKYRWMMDIFCVIMLLALVLSQRPLFYGLNADLFCTSLRSSWSRSSSAASSSSDRRHSGANELGSGSQIQGMLSATSYRVVIWKQTRLDDMPEEEKKRWTLRSVHDSRSLLVCMLLIVLFIGHTYGIYYCGYMGRGTGDYLSADYLMFGVPGKLIRHLYVALPLLLYVIFELMIWRARRPYCRGPSSDDSESNSIELTIKSTRHAKAKGTGFERGEDEGRGEANDEEEGVIGSLEVSNMSWGEEGKKKRTSKFSSRNPLHAGADGLVTLKKGGKGRELALNSVSATV